MFVADFLGTANILTGRVLADGGLRVFELAGGHRLALPNADHAVNGNRLVFRPQHVTLQRDTANTPTALRGTVRKRDFLGAIIRYTIDRKAGMLVCEQPFVGSDQLFSEGEPVHASIASRYLMVLTD